MSHQSFVIQVFLISVLSVVLCNWPAYASTESCGHSQLPGTKWRVVNGSNATVGEFPWQVSLMLPLTKRHYCGASLIDNQTLITAAHCVEGGDMWKSLFVMAGTRNVKQWDSTLQKVRMREMRVHPSYNKSTLAYDIAIGKLTEPLRFGNGTNVGAVCLDDQPPSYYPVGEELVVTGWGMVKQSPSTWPEILQKGKLNRMPLDVCKTKMGERVNPQYHVCAFGAKTATDSCNGDSGGPMVAYRGGAAYQVGVVSWGSRSCGQKDTFGVYSSIAYFRQWIEENRY